MIKGFWIFVLLVFTASCGNGSAVSRLNGEDYCIYTIQKFGFSKDTFNSVEVESIVSNIESFEGSVIYTGGEQIQARARCGLNSYDIGGGDIPRLVSFVDE